MRHGNLKFNIMPSIKIQTAENTISSDYRSKREPDLHFCEISTKIHENCLQNQLLLYYNNYRIKV